MLKRPGKNDTVDYISEKTKKVVYRFYKKNKIIRYFINSEYSKPYNEIVFQGFEKVPSGFYSEGYGITIGAYLIDKYLKDKVGEQFQLVIAKQEPTSIKKLLTGIKVVFNYKDFKKLQDKLREIKAEKNSQSENATQYYFNSFFPTYFDAPEEVEGNVYSRRGYYQHFGSRQDFRKPIATGY